MVVEVKERPEELNGDELARLTAQLEAYEKKQAEKEVEEVEEVPQETEVTDEDMERWKQLQAEYERLQNDGIFRTELIYQNVNLNASLTRIAVALEKLGGLDAQR